MICGTVANGTASDALAEVYAFLRDVGRRGENKNDPEAVTSRPSDEENRLGNEPLAKAS